MLVLRRREPDRERKFRTPLPWVVGIGGILGCVYLFFSLPTQDPDYSSSARRGSACPLRIYGSGARRRGAGPLGATGGRHRSRHDRRPTHRLRNIVGGSRGQSGRMVRLVRLCGLRALFRAGVLPQGRPDRAIAQRPRRCSRSASSMRPIGAWVMGIYADRKGRKAGLTLSVIADVRRLAADRGGADLCQAGLLSPGDPGRRADDPGAQPGRRIWLERDLSVGDGGPGAARLLVELPICHAHRRAIARAGAAAAAAGACSARRRWSAWGWRIALRGRRGAGGGGVLHPPPADETESFTKSAAATDRPKSSGAQPVPRPSARGVAGDGADRRGHARLLRLHHLHAEIPRQHRRFRPRDGVADHDRGAGRVHAAAAARGALSRPGRAPAGDDLLRHRRRAA